MINEFQPMNHLSRLQNFICTIGNLPTSYVLSMSYEEQVWWLCNFLETKIFPAIENNTEITEETQKAFLELQQYVTDYFNNLDVQDEINNKLDEMLEDGSLLNLLSNYANIQRIYNTVNEMIVDTSLTTGQKVKCFGFNEINDGDGGEFLIGNEGEIDLNNNLKAKYINNYENDFYNEITVEKIRRYDTDCYITRIPLNDNNNNIIMPYVAKNQYSNQSPMKYAQDNKTSLTINASLYIKNTNDDSNSGIPIIIGNGNIINNHQMLDPLGVADNFLYLGIDENRNFHEFKVNNTNAQQLLNSGCKQVFDIYYKLINNYLPTDLTNVVTNESDVVRAKNPRQVIAELQDKTILILTCDGRTVQNLGLTSQELQNILVEYDVKNAWNIDGGGSTSTTIKGSKINRNIDSHGTVDRFIPYTLNFKKNIKNENIANAEIQAGIIKQQLNEQIMPLILNIRDISGKDLNDFKSEFIVGYGNGMRNKPSQYNGYFINLPHPDVKNYTGKYAKQLFFNRDMNIIYTRNLANDVYSEWKKNGKINFSNFGYVVNNIGRHTISQSNTYEVLPNFQLRDTRSNNNYITFDENLHAFKVSNCKGLKMKMNFQSWLIVESGDNLGARNKFVKATISQDGVNWSEIQDFLIKQTVPDLDFQYTTKMISECMMTMNTNEVLIKLEVYGNQGNKFERISVNFEFNEPELFLPADEE